MLRFLVLAFTFSLGNCVVAQSEVSSGPRTVLEFLNSGDLVGLKSIEGTTSVVISVYTKDKFELATQILDRGRATTNARKFAADNALVRKELENYIARSEATGLAEDKLMVMPLIRTTLGTIVQLGDDYVLIEFSGESKRRCVIPKASIGKIYLDASPIRFYGPRRAIASKDG